MTKRVPWAEIYKIEMAIAKTKQRSKIMNEMGDRLYAPSVVVAGTSFYRKSIDRVPVIKRSLLSFKPNPFNPYDQNAIEVHADGKHIGHVPAAMAARMYKDGVVPVAYPIYQTWTVKDGKYHHVEFDIYVRQAPGEAEEGRESTVRKIRTSDPVGGTQGLRADKISA